MKQRVRRPRDCRPPTEPGITTLSGIVASYVANYRWSATAEHAFYGQPPSLTAAVERAALCVRPDGKRHSHQTRIPRRSLAEANQRLQAAPIASCRSFDELHAVVEEWTRDVPKIGDLAVYDIAHRIGAYLGLEPTLVYLHCGTRVGARALGLSARDTLHPDALPREFRQLSPAEIEDCLCIYKDEIARISGQRSPVAIHQ